MTARNQPHKYRCETCAYFVGKMENAFGVDQPFCSNPKIVEYNKQKPETGGQISPTQWRIEDHYIMKKDLYFSPMSNFDVERIGALGCASHSDATKAEQRIADVITELEKRKEHYYKQSCRHDSPPENESEVNRRAREGLLRSYCERMNGIVEALALLREKGG